MFEVIWQVDMPMGQIFRSQKEAKDFIELLKDSAELLQVRFTTEPHIVEFPQDED